MSHKEKLDYHEVFPMEQEVQPEDFNDALDIPEIRVDVNINFETPASEGEKIDFDKDIQYVRNKLLNGIGQADKILTSLLKKIIIDDETSMMPEQQTKGYHKYYEASTELLKSICDSSKELLNLHSLNLKTKKEMGWIKEEEDGDGEEKPDEKPKKMSGNLSDIVNKFKNTEKENKNVNINNDSDKSVATN